MHAVMTSRKVKLGKSHLEDEFEQFLSQEKSATKQTEFRETEILSKTGKDCKESREIYKK